MKKSRGFWGALFVLVMVTILWSKEPVIKFLGSRAEAQVDTSPLLHGSPANYQIASLPDDSLGPFAWGWQNRPAATREEFDEILAKKDPLAAFRHAFRLLRDTELHGSQESRSMAKKVLDFMMDDYQPAKRNEQGTRWLYGFSYEGIPESWWSGMDAFFGPLALYAGWQQFGDYRYKEAAIKSARLALQSPELGGVLWRTARGCWISEYAWENMKAEDEFHVLNGHLFGLQALYMLASLTQDPVLKEGYECARLGSQVIENDFYLENRAWSWYQTTPEVINPTHYLLFEMAQYRALRILSDDPIWNSGETQRAEIFRNAYPLQLLRLKEGGYRLLISMLGAPHSYWPDTYPIELICTADNLLLRSFNDKLYSDSYSYAERFFVSLDVPDIPQKCQVSVNSFLADKNSFVYEETDFHVESPVEIDTLPVTPKLSYNAVAFGQNNREIVIDPTGGSIEARIKLPLGKTLSAQDTVAFVIESDFDTQISMMLEDESGKIATRDYNDILAGKRNIVLLNRLGFIGQKNLDEVIESLHLRVHSGENRSIFKLRILSMALSNSPVQLQSFLEGQKEAYFKIQ